MKTFYILRSLRRLRHVEPYWDHRAFSSREELETWVEAQEDADWRVANRQIFRVEYDPRNRVVRRIVREDTSEENAKVAVYQNAAHAYYVEVGKALDSNAYYLRPEWGIWWENHLRSNGLLGRNEWDPTHQYVAKRPHVEKTT